MVQKPRPVLVTARDYPEVSIGRNVTSWGEVEIGPRSQIGTNVVVGTRHIDREGRRAITTRIGHDVQIGENVVIHNGAELKDGAKVDDFAVIGEQTVIGERSRILYGAQLHWKVQVGPKSIVSGFCCDRSVVQARAIMLGKLVHRARDPWAPWDETDEPSPVIMSRAFVGFDAFVIGGVKVHPGSYVAAGAIVLKDVAQDTMVIGKRHVPRAKWQKSKTHGPKSSGGGLTRGFRVE